jgi:hypothetical protein
MDTWGEFRHSSRVAAFVPEEHSLYVYAIHNVMLDSEIPTDACFIPSSGVEILIFPPHVSYVLTFSVPDVLNRLSDNRLSVNRPPDSYPSG